MASRKNDIDALILKINYQYSHIESLYKDSLDKKEVGSNLKIEIKNYLENSRSILDYCAHDIADFLGIKKDKIFFPIVGKDDSILNFEGSVGRNLPGLKSKNISIFNYLEGIQPYHQSYAWLADFSAIANDNKHQNLVPQTRTEIKEFTLQKDKTVATFKGCHFSGNSVDISFCGVPLTINPVSQFPEDETSIDIQKKIWIDFKFNNNISALPFLSDIHDGIPAIIDKIYKLL